MINLDRYSFHDTNVLRIIEDIENSTLTMEVEYPIDWEKGVFEYRHIVFRNVHRYQHFDGPQTGPLAILDMSVIDAKARWSQLRIDTNYGYIELWCEEMDLVNPEDKTKQAEQDRGANALPRAAHD